jgi:hypothetical protein
MRALLSAVGQALGLRRSLRPPERRRAKSPPQLKELPHLALLPCATWRAADAWTQPRAAGANTSLTVRGKVMEFEFEVLK